MTHEQGGFYITGTDGKPGAKHTCFIPGEAKFQMP